MKQWLLFFVGFSFVNLAGAEVSPDTVNLVDQAVLKANDEAVQKHMREKGVAEGWEWFSHRSHGFRGTPMIVVKLLPELDAEIWGPPAEKFSRFGHFVLPGDEDRILPTSLGMASFPTPAVSNPVVVTTETCATCHTGRVRLDDRIVPLYGGVNVQFDIRKWRTALEKTVEKYLATNRDIRTTARQLRDVVRAKPAGFFDANLDPKKTPDQRRLDEEAQREYFLKDGGAETMLANLVADTKIFTTAKSRQRATAYRPTGLNNPPDIDEGYPGKVDASGDLLAQRLPTHFGMPESASLTDIPSVWRQSEYSSGQWDGSVTSQFIRNLAAQVAVVPGKTVDRRVANFALAFVTELPAPKFPFASTLTAEKRAELLARGETLYNANCRDCHSPKNDRYYPEVRTDLSRANVMTSIGTLVIGKIFYDACHAKLPDGTSPPTCGNFADFIRGANKDETGGPSYVAKPLTGIWARAPYLHNGSVPTLRHLLLSKTRPQKFVVGSLSYDRDAVGYAWDPKRVDEYRKLDPYVQVMDTSEDSLSNQGHDQEKINLDGKTYRLDWTGDEADAEALIEYLKML